MIGRSPRKPAGLTRAVLLCAVLALGVSACGGRDETPSVPVGVPRDTLATVPMLMLAPEGTGLAVAFPPMTPWWTRASALADDMGSAGESMRTWVATQVDDLAREFGVEGARSFREIAHDVGIDPDAAFAVYLAPGAPQSPETGATEDAAFACVVRCVDPAKTEAALTHTRLDRAGAESASIHGVTIYTRRAERFSYFIADDLLVFGTNETLVAGVAARLSDPLEVRYGTPDCPAGSDEEIVALIWADRLIEADHSIVPFLSEAEPDLSESSRQWLSLWGALPDSFESDDPAVATVRWNDAGMEWLFRIDGQTHPRMAASAGEPKPLRLAPALPPTVEAVASFRIAADAADALDDVWAGLMPDDVRGDPMFEIARQQMGQASALLSDEVAIGMLGIAAEAPGFVVLAAIEDGGNPAALFGPLSGLFSVVDRVGDTEIFALPAEMGVPIAFAVHTNLFAAGPNPDEVRTMVTQLLADTPSPFFGQLDPPVDARHPRRSLIVLPRRLITDLALPLAAGNIGESAEIAVEALARHFREVRIEQDWQGDWLATRFVLVAD